MNGAKKVLIVEENPAVLHVLDEILTLAGAVTTLCRSPAEYKQRNQGCWCRQSPCPCHDFMLIDKGMTEMSGFDFLDKLSEGGCRLPNQRKALISGDWPPEDQAAAQQEGIRVLPKPFDVAEILDWICNADSHPKTKT